MGFSANFTAIDFETANGQRDSACQLAAVRVRGGQIVHEKMWMIRPQPLSFSPMNIQIHGITPDQVEQEPEFADLWDEISETFGDDCLVAHNASFDVGVLVACLRTHNQPIPEFHFTCTRALARRTWQHRRGYGLKPLSEWLGIQFRHHDALEDSIACAKILLACGIDQQATSVEDLENKLRITRGRAGPWGYKGPANRRAAPSRSTRGQRVIDLQRLMIRAEFIRPLDGKRVVFSGRFVNFNLQQAKDLASRLGGICQQEVGEGTDYVVLGKEGNRASQHQNASSTANPQVLSEDEFLDFLISEKISQ